jgi:DUF1680 family protein
MSDVKVKNGYAVLHRQWQREDTIAVELAMPVERIAAHPKVEANRGRVAIRRGPVVFCMEGCDNLGHVSDVWLPRDSTLSYAYQPDLLGGVGIIKASAMKAESPQWDNRLYQRASESNPCKMTAVPYAVWNNREPGPMQVWIPEAAGLAR